MIWGEFGFLEMCAHFMRQTRSSLSFLLGHYHPPPLLQTLRQLSRTENFIADVRGAGCTNTEKEIWGEFSVVADYCAHFMRRTCNSLIFIGIEPCAGMLDMPPPAIDTY